MKYKGIELTEYKTTENVIFDPPKKMLVWNDTNTECLKDDVVAVIPSRKSYPVVGVKDAWRYCAEISEQAKTELATNRELSKWLMEGNGEMAYANGDNIVSDTDYAYGYLSYSVGMANLPVEGIAVRKWEDADWHAPTREYMGIKE